MSIPKALPEFRTDASPDRECKRCVALVLVAVGALTAHSSVASLRIDDCDVGDETC